MIRLTLAGNEMLILNDLEDIEELVNQDNLSFHDAVIDPVLSCHF